VTREWHEHTIQKLEVFSDYIMAFGVASKRSLNRVYLDVCAGETDNVLKGTTRSFAGSLAIALTVEPPFTHVRAFEKSARRAAKLRTLQAPARCDFQVIQGDCNITVPAALAGLPPQAATFAFVDPDGLNVHWSTVKAIADHKRAYVEGRGGGSKAEQWILFSHQALGRILGEDEDTAVSREWLASVTRLFGAYGPWRDVWDLRREGRIVPGIARRAYIHLYMERLEGLGYKFVFARPFEASRGEIYVMVFASDHVAGNDIMRFAVQRPRTSAKAAESEQGSLFELAGRVPMAYTAEGWREELLPPGVTLSAWVEA
jgi:three-Cys-motif partner protein